MSSQLPNKSKFNIAYSVAKFFVENTRATILILALLIITGISSVFLLTPSGFPGAEIRVIVINTFYPGATSENVVKDVTGPIEGAIKDIEGIDTFNSNSSNSFSNLSISLTTSADLDKVISEIQKEIEAINFPEEVTEPVVFSPKIDGPDIIFAISGENRAELFTTYSKFREDVSKLSQTSSVSAQVELAQKVVIVLDKQKLKDEKIAEDQIKIQLSSIGQSLPVASNVVINDQNKSISTTLNTIDNLDQIKNFKIFSSPSQSIATGPTAFSATPTEPKSFRLEEIALVEVQYFYVDNRGDILDDIETLYGFNLNNNGVVLPSVLVNVRASEGANLNDLETRITELSQGYDNVTYASYDDISKKVKDGVLIIKGYSVSEQNQEQIDEVVNGLISGIILVFVLMLIFVSWRAAILSSIGIPLSLAFTTIYLLIVGENLNTLVLFSLVLVVGLVVDPALVVLESIQRKKDLGLNSKEAILEAMRDIGDGLLISTLTNLIVFLPFAVVSGTLGQIFGYIPLTIMPAMIGSYVVAIVFLAFIGGGVLKRNKKSNGTEEENLWRISRWFIKINEWILNVNNTLPKLTSITLRTVFIFLALIIPIGATGYLFSSGNLKSVQFASDPNTPYLSVSGEFLGNITQADKLKAEEEILQLVNSNEAVYGTVRQSEFTYIILLKDVESRGQFSTQTSQDVAKSINNQVQDKFANYFFDIQVGIINNGPPSADYQVSLAVKSEDAEALKNASIAIGQLALDKVCQTGPSEIQIKDNCEQESKVVVKVDDGFTNRENKEISIVIDRNKIIENGLFIANTPLLAFVNQQVAANYNASGRENLGKMILENSETNIILTENVDNPKSIEEIGNITINSLSGKTFALKDLATIEEASPKQSITRLEGETVNRLSLRLNEENSNNQGLAAQIGTKLVEYYANNDSQPAKDLGLDKNSVQIYSAGGTAEFTKTFTELGIALILSIFLIYFLLVVFFKSFTMPLTIMFTIPLTFLGAFPALALFVGDEFGFLEIIGLIILVGLVVNVAIYLIDLANQKIDEGWTDKKAIAFASGVRLRPIFLTNITAIASLAPLFFTSDFYKSIATVIMFGLSSSAITSLFTTPVLFVFFKWISNKFKKSALVHKIVFILFLPIASLVYILAWLIQDLKQEKKFKAA